MEMLGIMKRVELFRGLTDDQLMHLAGIIKTETYPQGATICKQGDMGDKMYVVAHGQVEIRVQDSHGASYSAVYLGEGQVVGEMALLDEGKRSATVVAVHDGTVMFAFPNRDFALLCRNDTAIGYVMMRNLAQDLSFKLRHLDAN